MSVVYHIRSSAGLYGAEVVILNLLPELQKEIDVKLLLIEDYITHDRSLFDAAASCSFETKEIKCSSRFDIKTIISLYKIFRNSKKSYVVHSHDVKSSFYIIIISIFLKCNLVTTLHGWTKSSKALAIYTYIEKFILRFFDNIVIVSEKTKTELSTKYLEEKITYIPNAVNLKKFNKNVIGLGRKHWAIPASRYVFGMFARFTSEKGHLNLIQSFSLLVKSGHEVHLLLLGNGPLVDDVETKIHELGLSDRVSLFPFSNDIQRVYRDIDCYVLSSLTEGMPLAVLESMASGVPVVATDVGAIKELLNDNAGIVVEAESPEKMAIALENMYLNKYSVSQLTNNAYNKVASLYSVSRQAKAHLDIYKRCLL